MALTLGNLVGFETGGLEEAKDVNDSPLVQDTTKRTGTFALKMDAPTDNYCVDYDPAGVEAGNDYIIGFAVQFSSTSPSAEDYVCRCMDGAGLDNWYLKLQADGDLVLYDAGDSAIGTATAPFTAGQWDYVEVWWEKLDSGSCKVYVNGIEEISVTNEDLDANGSFYGYYLYGQTDITTYFDDIYCYSGASGTGDFLGIETEVLGAYQNTVEDALDQGDTLDQGTWADTGDTPVDDEVVPAGYTVDQVADGHTICDEGARDGPAGDVGGTIKGAKWIHRLKRGNGGATTHQKRYGHNGDTTPATITTGSSWANYFTIFDASDSKVPTNTEYFAQGMARGGGGRELYCAEMWACLLHVAVAAPTRIPRPPAAYNTLAIY